MTTSLILTINNRSPEVSKQVADSLGLPGNEVDELIVVLDRPTTEAKLGASSYLEVDCKNQPFTARFIDVEGSSGWKGPAIAWNAGFKEATGDLFYCISSEVVQDPGNVEKANELCKDGNTVVFGACHNSEPTQCFVGGEPGELATSRIPRPLGFIVCMPRTKVEEIGGFDEEFMKGFWFDDDDFMLRLWRTGVDFVFDDTIHGTHIHHDRPVLSTPEGQAGILRNRAYMLKKHGTTFPWSDLIKVESRQNGLLRWSHV